MFSFKAQVRACFTLVAFLCLMLQALASPFQIEQDSSSLRFLLDKKVVVEVEPLSEVKLKALRAWLLKPNFSELKAFGEEVELGTLRLRVRSSAAQRLGSTPEALAAKFVDLLYKELVPALSWGRKDFLLPLGESKALNLKVPPGVMVRVEVSAPELVELRTLDEGKYVLKGIARGELVLRATTSSGQELPELPISVKPWAASWGDGPGKFDYSGAVDLKRIKATVDRWLSSKALAGSAIASEVQGDPADGSVNVLAQASAGGAISVAKSFKIAIAATPAAALLPAQVVLLSNHPEKIFGEGVLFQRKAVAASYRLMWHHRNDPEGVERFVWIRLTNPNPTARRLRLVWSSYGPSADEIHVGHTAALNYAAQAMAGLAQYITLPASGSTLLEIRRVKPGQTISGMAYLADDSGASMPLEVVVSSSLAQALPPSVEVESKDPGRTASGIFPAQLTTKATHVLGGPYTYVEYGNEPYVQDMEGSYPSYGNFGTIYRTRLMLFNPAEEVRQADIGFASAGGAARGVLAVDGTLYDLPMGRSGEGVPVATVSLQPGELRQVELELFPQAGSNYPIRIVVKSSYERREKRDIEPASPFSVVVP